MDAHSLLKALLINAAYEGAGAVCGPLQVDDGKPLPIDPLVQDVGLQKKGVLVYEEAKIQYNALLCQKMFTTDARISPNNAMNSMLPSAVRSRLVTKP